MEPDITGLSYYAEAFFELGSCRVNTMSLSPIPFTALVEYFKVYPVGDFEDFHYLIRVMDKKFLEIGNKQNKAATRARGKNG